MARSQPNAAWCIVDGDGAVQYGVIAHSRRSAIEAITSLAPDREHEMAGWNYWKKLGFQAVRCEVRPMLKKRR
jgi:hypothetical protein